MKAESRDYGSTLNALGKLGAGGVAVGVLVAGLAMPAIGSAGIGVRDAANGFVNLPANLREAPLPEMTRLLDATGKQFAQFYHENRESVRIGQVAPAVRQAIVAIEDTRFYEHGGFDIKGTARALITNAQSGSIRQGGSTLTQQYVKNVLMDNAKTDKERKKARAVSVSRKVAELRHAVALEKRYTKEQILERYLNIAYFGAGAFGVQAAARRFFGKSASGVTLPEAATIAGAVRAPYSTDPSLGPKSRTRLFQRRNVVLDRMAHLKMITPTQAGAAKKGPLAIKLQAQPGGCEMSKYPFFCIYVQRELLTNPAFGRDERERGRRLRRGGLVIKTTLDPRTQDAAERAIRGRVDPDDTEVAAEAMVEPGTGRIKAMAASKKYGRNKGNSRNGPYTNFNLVADIAHGGGQGFQAGSTFKVFTLATALKEGWRFDKGFGTPGSFVAGSGYKDCKGKPVNAPGVRLHNAGGEGSGGYYNISTGTWQSVNIFFMKLEREVGLCDTVETARSLGIRRADGTPLREVPTFTLGANEMDPITVAAAFAGFGARGKFCDAMAITEIMERGGRRIEVPPSCRQVMDPEVADAVSHVLEGVFSKGTMKGQGIGRDAAGKTGTNNDYTSSWFAGYTPDLAAAVSVGDMRGAYRYPLSGVAIGGEYYGSVQGSALPGPIWVTSMRTALKGSRPAGFHRPNHGRFGFVPKDVPEKDRRARPTRPGGQKVGASKAGAGGGAKVRKPKKFKKKSKRRRR